MARGLFRPKFKIGDSETMRIAAISKISLAILALSWGQHAAALDVNGYIRALAGANSASGNAACFKLAGAGSKYLSLIHI